MQLTPARNLKFPGEPFGSYRMTFSPDGWSVDGYTPLDGGHMATEEVALFTDFINSLMKLWKTQKMLTDYANKHGNFSGVSCDIRYRLNETYSCALFITGYAVTALFYRKENENDA